MKNEYQTLEMEVIRFDTEDVLTSSGCGSENEDVPWPWDD